MLHTSLPDEDGDLNGRSLDLGVRHWLVGELNDGAALRLWRLLHRAVLHQRARRGSTTGIATGCIGVGQGLALVLER